MKNSVFVGVIGLFILMNGGQGVFAQQGEVSAEARADKKALVVTEEYIIGPQDQLEINVWKAPELTRQVVVRPDGAISLPLVGDIKAVGRTPQELQAEITTKLREYMQSPTVAVIVNAVNSYYFFVQGAVGGRGGGGGSQGAVGGGGKIPLLSRTTLVQAITLAGGLASDAVRDRIMIFRLGRNGSEPQKFEVNYDAIILRGAENIEIKPGDTIVVPSQTQIFLPSSP